MPFAPGVVSTEASGESTLSFSPDGSVALFGRYEDWQAQTPVLAEFRAGAWRDATPAGFAETVYNASIADDGSAVIYCLRDDENGGERVLLARRAGEGWDAWAEPIDLTASAGLRGSYFDHEPDGTLYFHRDGELYHCSIAAGEPSGVVVSDPEPLPAPVNTPGGVEFSPRVEGDRLIFTRAIERGGQLDRAASGVFVSFRLADGWAEPARLPVPYGWGCAISPDGEDLVYTVDAGIVRVPLVLLEVLSDED